MSETPTAELLSQLTAATEYGGIDLAIDPATAQQVGQRLARQIAQYRPTSVMTWDDENDTVLGHIVALTLGVPRSTISLDLGLLSVSGAPAGERVALVSVQFDEDHPITSVSTLLERGERHLTVAASTLSPDSSLPAAPDVPMEVLD